MRKTDFSCYRTAVRTSYIIQHIFIADFDYIGIMRHHTIPISTVSFPNNRLDKLKRLAEILYEAGADGYMAGIITADGQLDIKRMKEVLKRVPGKPFTLHRAFESTRDQFRTLEECVDLGIDYILTGGLIPGGGLDTARLAKLIEKADNRIKIVVALGSGFTVDLLEPIIKQSGATEYHIVNGYRQRLSNMKFVPGGEALDDDHLKKKLGKIDYLEESAVRELRDIFNKYE